MTPPIVIRHRAGRWYVHCRPCADTISDGVLTQPLAVEVGLRHLGGQHQRAVGFAGTAARPSGSAGRPGARPVGPADAR
jgi:hypothetical protein